MTSHMTIRDDKRALQGLRHASCSIPVPKQAVAVSAVRAACFPKMGVCENAVTMKEQITSYDFFCYGCGAVAEAGDVLTCPACGEPYSIRSQARPPAELFERAAASMWDYADLLPVSEPGNIVTLKEGGTPLVEASRFAESVGVGRLFLKNETLNPTGSFKDRQVSAGISHAKEIGADTVAVVSSGNVACAASAYAAQAGMRAVLMMPRPCCAGQNRAGRGLRGPGRSSGHSVGGGGVRPLRRGVQHLRVVSLVHGRDLQPVQRRGLEDHCL